MCVLIIGCFGPKVKGYLNNFYVSSGKIKIRLQENSKLLTITHVEDLKIFFPDVDFNTKFLKEILNQYLSLFQVALIVVSQQCIHIIGSRISIMATMFYVETNQLIFS